MSIVKYKLPITSLEDWFARAGPKRSFHWRDGRSAKESARAWLGAGASLPPEVEAVLANGTCFGRPLMWTAEPEAKLRFDRLAGEPRNSDLLVLGSDAHGAFVMAIEAKADESFGESVAVAISNAAKRRADNPRSNGLLRIEQLETALLGPVRDGECQLGDLRYQLLTATAGVLGEAERRGITRAVLLVHEFVTDGTRDEKHVLNGRDLGRFVHRLSHGVASAISDGQLIGPFAVPGAPLFASGAQLFIAKAVRRMRSSSTLGTDLTP